LRTGGSGGGFEGEAGSCSTCLALQAVCVEGL
jgi:hypothetical protein